jgi:cysteine desulfurase family protein (TIGR01976 family)
MFSNELLKRIRSEFPRAERDAFGRARAFLDNGTGTLVVGRAAEAEAKARVDYSANVYGIFDESKMAGEVIHEGRKAVADLLNAPSPETIVSGESATSLFFGLSYAMGKELRGRENVVVTNYEHYANLSPWLELKRRGLIEDARFTPLNIEDGTLDLNQLGALIDGDTRVVSVSAASNALGTKTQLMEVGKMAREVGAYFIVDAVHHIAHGPLDVQTIGCDFLVFSGYKMFSPHGSFMYGRKELLEELRPYKVKPAPDHPPDSWEWGTRDQAKFAAIKGVVDHHEWLAKQVEGGFVGKLSQYSGRRRALKVALTAVEEYEKEISRVMLTGSGDIQGLTEMPHVKVYGLKDPERLDDRDPTFSFKVNGLRGEDVVERLWAKHAIAMRSEDFYSRVHEVYESPTLIRASFVQYNTVEEALRLLKALETMKAP